MRVILLWFFFLIRLPIHSPSVLMPTIYRFIVKLEPMLEVFQTRFMPFNRLCFNLIRLHCPANLAITDCKKSHLWPKLWRHQWSSNNILLYIWKLHARVYPMPFSDQESIHHFGKYKGTETPPPPIGGQSSGIPHRGAGLIVLRLAY